jgi:pyrimidine and pyridine-specific 5'-nucleotidase
VLKILDLRDLFDGIVSCDYADPSLYVIIVTQALPITFSPPHSTCKPEPEYYAMAMRKASLDPNSQTDRAKCLFVDDSLSNVRGAKAIPWKSSIWFREKLTPSQRAHLVSGAEASDNVEQAKEKEKERVEQIVRAPSGSYAEQLKQGLEGGDGKDTEGVDAVISNLQELRDIWSFIFKEGTSVAVTPSAPPTV